VNIALPGRAVFLDPDAGAMDSRLRARLTRGEFFALALAFSTLGLFLWLDASLDYIPFDYNVYMQTAHGNLLQYYYADWILPLFWLWAKFPPLLGFTLWSVVNILSLFLAARVFGGRTALTLLTFQFFYSLFLGQINGLLVGGVALGWWGMTHKKWHLAGLGFWLASTKFQIGLPFGLLLWLTAAVDWRSRLRVLFLPFLLSLASFLFYPDWPFHLIERIHTYAPFDWGSISLWPTLGLTALLFLLPPLFLPMERSRRFLALAAFVPLALPYFQSADLLALFVLPVGWVPLILGNLGFLFFIYQFSVLRLLWFIPLLIYLSVLFPPARAAINSIRGKDRSPRMP
jgi:hypothetical protein